jgi:hypothetical protein
MWATEDCEYPEELQDQDKGLGDTVKIVGEGFVDVVVCRDDEGHPGDVCLMTRGCYPPSELEPISTLELTLRSMGQAAKQIWSAVSHDVKEAWRDVRMTLGDFGTAVAARISQEASDLHDAVNICDRDKGEISEKEFNKTLVQSKSRLAMLLESAAGRWQDAKEGIVSVVKATAARLVALAKQLSQWLGEKYDKHLAPKVEALKKYLGGIGAAVMDVPWAEDDKGDAEDAMEPAEVESNIDGFTTKIAEFHASLMEVSRDVYDKAAGALARVQAGAGRMIAALSLRFVQVMNAVKRMASAAYDKVKEWTSKALDFACNFSVKAAAKSAFDFMKEKVKQAVEAVKHGARIVKESLKAVADNIASTLSLVATKIKTTAVSLWESNAVQSTIAAIREEIRVLKELIVAQAKLVQKILGGFLRYFGRFVPSWLKNKLKTAGQKAKELAVKIQAEIAEVVRDTSQSQTETVEVEEDSTAVQ